MKLDVFLSLIVRQKKLLVMVFQTETKGLVRASEMMIQQTFLQKTE